MEESPPAVVEIQDTEKMDIIKNEKSNVDESEMETCDIGHLDGPMDSQNMQEISDMEHGKDEIYDYDPDLETFDIERPIGEEEEV